MPLTNELVPFPLIPARRVIRNYAKAMFNVELPLMSYGSIG